MKIDDNSSLFAGDLLNILGQQLRPLLQPTYQLLLCYYLFIKLNIVKFLHWWPSHPQAETTSHILQADKANVYSKTNQFYEKMIWQSIHMTTKIGRGGFVEHLSPTWVAQQSVTQIISVTMIDLVTPKAGAKY